MEGISPTQITLRLKNVYGKGCIGFSTVCRLSKSFREGNEEIEDKPREGRPKKNQFIEPIRKIISENPIVSTKKISEKFEIARGTVKRILNEELKMIRVNLKWIPYSLNEEQKRKRVEISTALYKILSTTEKNKRYLILTCDESWFNWENPYFSVWKKIGSSTPVNPKLNIARKKLMICVVWSFNGFFSLTSLPKGHKFNKDFFIGTVLNQLKCDFAKIQPKNRTKGIKLHMDNARPHFVDEKLKEFGIKRLIHPPYSPGLAPSDFFLFGYLKNQLIGNNFLNNEDLLEEISVILSKIEKSTLESVFEEWKERLLWCINNNGEYLRK